MSRQKTAFCSILAIGVLIMFNLLGCSPGRKFDRYQSKDPDIGVSMLYPSGWEYSEDRGSIEKYACVLFLEPVGKSKHSLRSSIMVKVVKKSDMPDNLSEAGAAADDFMGKASKLRDFKFISRKGSKLFGEKAEDMVFSYKAFNKPLPNIGGFVSAEERDVVVIKNGKCYSISLVSQKDAFEGLDKVFSYVVKTIKLQR